LAADVFGLMPSEPFANPLSPALLKLGVLRLMPIVGLPEHCFGFVGKRILERAVLTQTFTNIVSLAACPFDGVLMLWLVLEPEAAPTSKRAAAINYATLGIARKTYEPLTLTAERGSCFDKRYEFAYVLPILAGAALPIDKANAVSVAENADGACLSAVALNANEDPTARNPWLEMG
jgi:hypothetical protein